MTSYRRALQFSIVFFFSLSTAACLSGSGGGFPQHVADGGSGDGGGDGGAGGVDGGGDGGAGGVDGGGSGSGGGGSPTGLTVAITQPGAQEIDTTDETMSLSGEAASPDGVSAVSWKTDNGHSGSASGTESWTVPDVPLELGKNTVTVTATDAAGETRTDTILINRESEGTGSVTLSWVPPTERTDGTPLQTLAGYKISFGRMSETYDFTVDIGNPGLASYVVEDLVPGDWYFVVAAYDENGLESDYSNEATRRVN